MARKRYKLLAGIHVGPDYSQEPTTSVDPLTQRETVRYPSKTYTRGDVVESERDLTLLANKFVEVTGRRGTDQEPTSQTFDPGQAQFPGGQVSSGLPEATGAPAGRPGQRLKAPESSDELPAAPPDLSAEQGDSRSGKEEDLEGDDKAAGAKAAPVPLHKGDKAPTVSGPTPPGRAKHKGTDKV